MESIPPQEVTRLLAAWSRGDKEALAKLMPLVCDELRELAQRYLRKEVPGHILQPTALVNELYIRLHGRNSVSWKNRKHFFGAAAQMMRRILVDHARHHKRGKRGGSDPPLPLDEVGDLMAAGQSDPVAVIALDTALNTLAKMDPRQAQIVEQRFFVGLTVEETAEVLGISTPTVKRDWKLAKLWLYRAINSDQARD